VSTWDDWAPISADRLCRGPSGCKVARLDFGSSEQGRLPLATTSLGSPDLTWTSVELHEAIGIVWLVEVGHGWVCSAIRLPSRRW
jgi:hypothetical protein